MLPRIQFIESIHIPSHLDEAAIALNYGEGFHSNTAVVHLDRSDPETMENEFVQWLISDRSFEFDDDSDSTMLVIYEN